MRKFFSRLRSKMRPEKAETEEGYVELETESDETHSKIVVRPFVIKDFEDVKEILDSLRAGHTIALVNIRPLKDKDLVELKRAINKLKKTCDAIEGEIAGFGEDWIIITPSFATIYRSRQTEDVTKGGDLRPESDEDLKED
jgi:SepF-like predicted cell division protein (DUF552 family)